MTARLTIAIPTYDRNAMLRATVAALVPQLTEETQLIVLDNASPTPAAETLAKLTAPDRARVIRNRVNVGSSANVMRCIELCETPWLWILGDDDPPLPDAVATALGEIDRRPDCLLVNFASKYESTTPDILTHGVEEFLERAPSLANLTLISNNVLRADLLAAHVRTGHFFAYSIYPHFACVLSALLETGASCCFTSRRLVSWGPVSEWSRVMAGLGAGTLLDLPLPAPVRRRLAPRLMAMCGRYSSLTIHLLDQVGHRIDAPTARFLYGQAWHRLYKHRWSLLDRLVRCAGMLMLTFPSLSKRLYQMYRRLRGNPYEMEKSEMRRM